MSTRKLLSQKQISAASLSHPREPAQIINQSVQAVSVVHRINEKRLHRIEQQQKNFMQLARV